MIIKLPKYLYILLFVLASTVAANAQYNQPLSDYVIEVWSADEGLPSNNLRHIAKDNEGFLWISTFNGLVRFDGVEFKNFDIENVPSLTSSSFYSVQPLPDGKMYISTQSSGIVILEGNGFHNMQNVDQLPASIQTTFLDSTNRLWIGTRNNGLYYFENSKLTRLSIPTFDTQSIMSFTQDASNNIWVASEGAGVAKVNPENDEFEIYTKEDGLVSNLTDAILFHDQKIYVGTEKGLSIFDYDTWETDERFSNFPINYIVADASSNIWFAADNGLARIIHPNKFEFISEKDGLPARQISSITFDNENNIWLSTKRGGLVQLKLSNFKNITTFDGLSYKGVNVIEQDANGSIYVGSDNGDLDIIIDDVVTKFSLKKNLSGISIKDIFIDDAGVIWLATYDGLIRINGDDEQYYTVEDGLLSNKTRRILKGSDGVLWVGSRNGGLNKIFPDGRIESISVKDGLGSDFVFSVDETPNGRIVVGTANGGLNIISKDGSIEILKPDSLIVGLSIFNVYIESEDRFWLATNVGLYCYQNDNFTLLNVKNGLPVETLFDIEEDDKGNIWATSILGLVKVLKKEVQAVANGELKIVSASLLNKSDGMVSRECTGATKFLKAADGKLWIPTIKGIAILDPQKLIENFEEPSIFIEEVLVDDQKLPWIVDESGRKNVTINPGHRNYSIKFTSLSMYSPEKVKFTYKLEGFDEDWVENGAVRVAKYTNIPYGSYTFKVMAANNNGIWSTDYATINIDIKPYFYETTWFVVLLILLFISATVFIYSYQTREVKRRNSELLKLNGELDSFAYSVSHDLKAPLSSIQGLLNVAKLESGENAMEYYRLIDVSVEKLDSFIKDIIDYSKNSRLELRKETIQVKELISGILESLVYLNKDIEIEITVDIDESLEIVTDKTRFTFIANNLLTNAFRYADFTKDKSLIKLKAHTKNSTFFFEIEDNGQGIKKELQSRLFEMFYRANEHSTGSGLGLYIVKESLEKLGGNIEIDSEYKIGTKVHVQFPV